MSCASLAYQRWTLSHRRASLGVAPRARRLSARAGPSTPPFRARAPSTSFSCPRAGRMPRARGRPAPGPASSQLLADGNAQHCTCAGCGRVCERQQGLDRVFRDHGEGDEAGAPSTVGCKGRDIASTGARITQPCRRILDEIERTRRRKDGRQMLRQRHSWERSKTVPGGETNNHIAEP